MHDLQIFEDPSPQSSGNVDWFKSSSTDRLII